MSDNRRVDNGNDIESDNEADNEADIEVSTPTTEPISEGFTCPICGKWFRTEKSLHFHALKSHRTTSKGEPTPMSGPYLSTDSDLIRDILKGLKYDKIDAYLKMVDLRGFSIPSLYACAKDIGMPHSILKPLLSFWSSYKNEPIPLNILKELNISQPSFGPFYGPSYGPFGELTQQRFDPLYQDPLLRLKIMEYLDTLKEREEAKFRPVQTQPNNANAIEAHYQQQIEALRQEIQNLQQTHSKEVSALKEELHKKEMETLQNEIKRLESEIKRIESFKPVGDYKLDEFRLIADSLKTISEKAPLKELLAKLPEISAALSGIVPQQQTPQARIGLIELLRQRGLTVPQ
jgi:hypothetical protein